MLFKCTLQGDVPPPESFESVTVFLCDIVQFTNLSSESTGILAQAKSMISWNNTYTYCSNLNNIH